MTNADTEPTLIEGGLAVDDRGRLSFVNAFDFKDVKRFYLIENHRAGFVRAWHGHKKEAKYFFVLSGSAVVGAVKIDDWEKPSKSLPVKRYVLSGDKPCLLRVPAGYANGMMSLQEGTRIMIFSTTTLQESQGDDYRFDARHWDCWQVVER
ncbi:MAG: WxcM-like domain-containing protein [Elusimicrobia bacterium]|nr:WxcM-like domain-containing protein [Elusimicrobiota bacterium]